MASMSLERWNTDDTVALDQIESAHAAVGGSPPGRRYATLQINHAYVVLIASHFQRFCRDLHTEAVDYLCRQPPGISLDPRRDILRITLTLNRQFDKYNASPSNIGADFSRFNFEFWNKINAQAPVLNRRRKDLLEDLNQWRNAIAHQDFASKNLRPDALTLPKDHQINNSRDHRNPRHAT